MNADLEKRGGGRTKTDSPIHIFYLKRESLPPSYFPQRSEYTDHAEIKSVNWFLYNHPAHAWIGIKPVLVEPPESLAMYGPAIATWKVGSICCIKNILLGYKGLADQKYNFSKKWSMTFLIFYLFFVNLIN